MHVKVGEVCFRDELAATWKVLHSARPLHLKVRVRGSVASLTEACKIVYLGETSVLLRGSR